MNLPLPVYPNMAPNDTTFGVQPEKNVPVTKKQTMPVRPDNDSDISRSPSQIPKPVDDEKLPVSDIDEVDDQDTDSEHGRGRSPPGGDVEDSTRSQPCRRSSSFARTACVVPRGQRRGLLGKFSIIPEVEQPYEYNNNTKV